MKKFIFYTLTFAVVSLIFACSSTKSLSSYSPEETIVFGNGGGFAGRVTTYYLTNDGRIFKTVSQQKDTLFLAKIKKKEAAGLFSDYDRLGFSTLNFNHPGDRYSFIGKGFNSGQGRVTWGNPDFTPPEEVTDFYKKLFSYIKNTKK